MMLSLACVLLRVVIFHPSTCELNVWGSMLWFEQWLEGWRWLSPSEFVVLESTKDRILGVDTLGQHVMSRVRYETTFLPSVEIWVDRVTTESHSDGQCFGYFPRTLRTLLSSLGFGKPPLFVGTLRLLRGNLCDHLRGPWPIVFAASARWSRPPHKGGHCWCS
jgi:hypothetical protein